MLAPLCGPQSPRGRWLVGWSLVAWHALRAQELRQAAAWWMEVEILPRLALAACLTERLEAFLQQRVGAAPQRKGEAPWGWVRSLRGVWFRRFLRSLRQAARTVRAAYACGGPQAEQEPAQAPMRARAAPERLGALPAVQVRQSQAAGRTLLLERLLSRPHALHCSGADREAG